MCDKQDDQLCYSQGRIAAPVMKLDEVILKNNDFECAGYLMVEIYTIIVLNAAKLQC